MLLRVGFARWRQERSSRWSVDQLRRHQAHALDQLRRFAVERSDFYREFHRGLEGRTLNALPILDKATLMAQFDRVVTAPGLRLHDLEQHLAGPDALLPWRGADGERLTVLSTSGSTGLRGVFVFDRREWAGALASIMRPLAWAGAPSPLERRGLRLVRSRAALIASAAPWHYSAQVGRALATPLVPTLRIDAATPLAQIVDKLNDWQPSTLAVYPSVLLQLAQEQLAGRLRIALRHIGTSAERLPDATRERVRRAWGIRVFDTYGATEYAPIATECREGNLHLLEDRAIIEVVDDRGRVVPAGEPGSRLLLTVLDRRVQPLIRYELSDGVRERPGVCACGRPMRMLGRIEGRVEESLRLRAARGGAAVEIHPNLVHDVLERVPATGWQVRQESDAALTVLLTGTRADAEAAQLRERFTAALTERGAALPSIRVEWVDRLPRGASGKAPLIVAAVAVAA